MKNNFRIVYDILTKYIFDADNAYLEILFLIEKDELLFEDFWRMFSTNETLADNNIILTKDLKQLDKNDWIKEKVIEFIFEQN
jgi:hypothetical protein